MTFGQFLQLYMKQSKTDINTFAKLIQSSVDNVKWWCGDNDLPMFKVRCAILLKLKKTMGNSKQIVIEDSDGFTFTIDPQMSTKYQSEDGRQKYYESARWDKLKKKVFERAGYKCEICGCKGTGEDKTVGLNVHHMLYASDFGTGKEDLNELIVVCRLHHSMLHAADNEKKQEAYEDRTDGKYKILVLEKSNGDKEVKIFSDECTEKMIKFFVTKIEHKYHFKYKNWYVKDL